MPKKKPRILVFYGGSAGTNQRNELLAWLRRDTMNLTATIVAEAPPHSQGSIDNRVDEAIRKADKAIAIMTADDRLPHGAPNVMDEIGRWRGKKGGKSICIVRQEGVKPYSNHDGLPYVQFKTRIKEAFDPIRDFLNAPAEPTTSKRSAAAAKKTTSRASLIVDGNASNALIDGRLYKTKTIDQTRDNITIEMINVPGADEGALRRLENTHTDIKVVHGNTSALIRLKELRFTRSKTLSATLIARVVEPRASSAFEYTTFGPDGRQVSADDLATLRVSRILSNAPAPSKTPHDPYDAAIRGGSFGTAVVEKSPIPEWLDKAVRTQRVTWDRLRLRLVELLYDSGAVGHVESLKLHIKAQRLIRIVLRAARPKTYPNDNPAEIRLDVAVNF